MRGCLGELGRLSALQVAAIAAHASATGSDEAKRVANTVLCRLLADEPFCGELVAEIAGAVHDPVNGDGILGAGTTRLLCHLIVELCGDALSATTEEARKVIAAVGELWYIRHLASPRRVPIVHEEIRRKVSVPTVPDMPEPIDGLAFKIANLGDRLRALGFPESMGGLTMHEVSDALERIAASAETLGLRTTTRYGYPVCLADGARREINVRGAVRELMKNTTADGCFVLATILGHPKADLMLATVLSVGAHSHAQVLAAGDGEPVANAIAGSNVVPFADTYGNDTNEYPVFPNDSVALEVAKVTEVRATPEMLKRLMLEECGVPKCVFGPYGARVYATGGGIPHLIAALRRHRTFGGAMATLDGIVEELCGNLQCAVCMDGTASEGAICGARACTMRLCAGCAGQIRGSRDPRCPGCRRRFPGFAAPALPDAAECDK